MHSFQTALAKYAPSNIVTMSRWDIQTLMHPVTLGMSASNVYPSSASCSKGIMYDSASFLDSNLQVSVHLGSQSINLCCRSIASDSRRRAPLIVLVIGTSADLSSTMWLCASFEVWLLAAAVSQNYLAHLHALKCSPSQDKIPFPTH